MQVQTSDLPSVWCKKNTKKKVVKFPMMLKRLYAQFPIPLAFYLFLVGVYNGQKMPARFVWIDRLGWEPSFPLPPPFPKMGDGNR